LWRLSPLGPLTFSKIEIFAIILYYLDIRFANFGLNAAKEKLVIPTGDLPQGENCHSCGSAAFPNFRGGTSSPPAAAKCVRTIFRILHQKL